MCVSSPCGIVNRDACDVICVQELFGSRNSDLRDALWNYVIKAMGESGVLWLSCACVVADHRRMIARGMFVCRLTRPHALLSCCHRRLFERVSKL